MREIAKVVGHPLSDLGEGEAHEGAEFSRVFDTKQQRLALLWQIFAADERDGIPKSVFQ